VTFGRKFGICGNTILWTLSTFSPMKYVCLSLILAPFLSHPAQQLCSMLAILYLYTVAIGQTRISLTAGSGCSMLNPSSTISSTLYLDLVKATIQRSQSLWLYFLDLTTRSCQLCRGWPHYVRSIDSPIATESSLSLFDPTQHLHPQSSDSSETALTSPSLDPEIHWPVWYHRNITKAQTSTSS